MRPARVLVVDDEPLVCEMLQDCLAGEGWEVICATNAKEALGVQDVEVALVDAVLPSEVGGLELADRLEARGIPVLMMSGHAEALERVATSGRPIVGKPFRLSALLSELESRAARPAGSPVET